MKIINAIWDEKIIGGRVGEIIFTKGEDYNNYIQSGIEKGGYAYLVARVPSESISLIHDLENNGFRFLENQFVIRVKTEELVSLEEKISKKVLNLTTRQIIEKPQLSHVLSKIEEGLFENDRISLDPYLGMEFSARRYRRWIEEIYNNKQYRILYIFSGNETIGFMCLDCSSQGSFKALIAGVFKKYQNLGYSSGLLYLHLKYASDNGVGSVETSISGNNIKMVNLFSRTINYKVIRNYVVLRKLQAKE